MKKLFALPIVAVVLLVTFTYGVSVGRYEYPPFKTLQGAKQALFPPPEDGFGPGYLRRLSNLQAMPGSSVVMLGDSLTTEGEWSELLPGVHIANRGIGGDTSSGVLSRLGDILESPPEMVFLMIGINDLNRGVPVNTVARNIESILSTVQSSGATPIFQCTLHVGSDRPNRINSRVAQLNEKLRQFCDRSDIALLDLNPILAPEGYLKSRYTHDGVHLTGEVYVTWAEQVRRHVEKVQSARDVRTEILDSQNPSAPRKVNPAIRASRLNVFE